MAEEIIVIPDVHGRGFWKEAVAKYPNADTIFLGDYLDPYPNEDIDDEDAFNNFLEIVEYARNHSNVTLLFGNHDLQYWFPYDWGHRMKDCIIRKSRFSPNPKRSVRILGFCIKRSVQKNSERTT